MLTSPCAFTEEEKLEPVKAPTDDPRIRLLNRLYAKRRKELQDRKAPKEGTEGTEQPQSTDQRSLDELMNFIGGEQASKAKAKKKKSKKRSGGKAAGEGEVPGAVPEGPPSSRRAPLVFCASRLRSEHLQPLARTAASRARAPAPPWTSSLRTALTTTTLTRSWTPSWRRSWTRRWRSLRAA